MAETAQMCGTTVKVLQRLMPRHGIARRPAIKREQRGPLNDSWKGDAAGYAALHLRVVVARGRPAGCQRCPATDAPRDYEWANLTGAYEDVLDYESMCVPCHRKFDAARRRLTGRGTIPDRLRGEGNV